jgi:two-component system, response regulator
VIFLLLRQLRENEKTKLLPVIILTSSKKDRDILDGYKFGANSYVVKPVGFESFAKAVQELGLYWTLHNQPLPLR